MRALAQMERRMVVVQTEKRVGVLVLVFGFGVRRLRLGRGRLLRWSALPLVRSSSHGRWCAVWCRWRRPREIKDQRRGAGNQRHPPVPESRNELLTDSNSQL